MPLWKSSSFLGRSIIMNKKSQFTKIFFKAILDLKDSGTWDIMNGGKSRQMDQSYNLRDLILRLLGYKNGMENFQDVMRAIINDESRWMIRL